MPSPSRPTPSRWPFALVAVVFAPVVIFFVFLLAVVLPRGCAARSALTSLQPGAVKVVEIESREPGGSGGVVHRRALDAKAAAEFTALLSRARGHFVRRAIDGQRHDVKLVTDAHPEGLHFSIHLTTSQGVLLRVNSGGTTRWHYGTLRCDELGPFVAALFEGEVR